VGIRDPAYVRGYWDMSMLRPRWVWLQGVVALAWFLFASAGSVSAQSRRMTEEEFRAALSQLDSPDSAVRVGAADQIGLRGSTFRREASEKLRALLRGDSVATVRASAGRAIGRLGLRDALPDLITALADADTSVRIVAAAALWRLPDPAAVPALVTGLRDSDPSVRQWCALAVGVTEDARAAAPLTQALSDTVSEVRLEAVRSLARIGDPVGMEPLTRVAMDDRESLETRLEAVNALASVQSPDKANALVRLLDVSNQDVRAQVVRALGQVGDALVIPPLRRLAGTSRGRSIGQVIREAIAQIEARGSAPAVPPATQSANSPG